MRCNAKDMNPIPKALHIYQMSKFIRYSKALFLNFLTGGLFWAKNRKSSKNVAFCQKSSDLSVKHGVGSGLPHIILLTDLKNYKIADFMDMPAKKNTYEF